MADKTGMFTLAVGLSRASSDWYDVSVPTVVDPSGPGLPAVGSQAPELMGSPICEVTLGFEFK